MQNQNKCPKCSSKNGIIAVFINGSIKTKIFVYCSECKWEYFEELKISDTDTNKNEDS